MGAHRFLKRSFFSTMTFLKASCSYSDFPAFFIEWFQPNACLFSAKNLRVTLSETNRLKDFVNNKARNNSWWQTQVFLTHSISENSLSLWLPVQPFWKAVIAHGVQSIRTKGGTGMLIFQIYNCFETNKDMIEGSAHISSLELLPSQ